MRKFLVFVVVLVLVLGTAGVAAAAWSGIVQVPVLSAAFGVDQPRSLGGQPADPTGYQAWAAKLGIERPSPAGNYTFNSSHRFSGTVAISETIPASVLLGIPEFSNPSPDVRDIHMAFHNGYAETSAMVDLAGYGYPFSGPVFFRWTPTVTSARGVTVALADVTFGNIAVPADIAKQASQAVNDYLSSRLSQVSGLDINVLQVVEGGVHFEGTVPQVYEADAPAAGQLP